MSAYDHAKLTCHSVKNVMNFGLSIFIKNYAKNILYNISTIPIFILMVSSTNIDDFYSCDAIGRVSNLPSPGASKRFFTFGWILYFYFLRF